MKTEKYTERQFKLMKFYSVHNLDDLIEKQAEHIAKLQQKLQKEECKSLQFQEAIDRRRKVRDE